MRPTTAVIITHAGASTGGGHLSRCFALSQGLDACGVACRWIINEEGLPQAKSFSIPPSKITSVENPFTTDIAHRLAEASFAVVDSYEPDASFYAKLSAFVPIVAVDDLADRNIEDTASVVINYGVGATRLLYRNDSTEYLLGPSYALLRKDFWDVESVEGDRVVFVAGSSDVLNASAEIIELWQDDMPQLFVIGGSLLPRERRSRLEALASCRDNICLCFSPAGFADILAKAGFVICSASVTAYEALGLRKRTALFTVAENQSGLGALLAGMDAAFDLGAWGEVTQDDLRNSLAFRPDRAALETLVDRRGALRAAKKIIEVFMDGRT